MRFLSIDKAGNTETPRRVIVDDAPNTLDTAEPLSEGAHIRKEIDPEGDEDWFSFEADGSSTYRVQLLGLPADYDVELYDRNGKKVEAPYRRGKATEEFAAGRYYVRVVGYEGAWHPGA